MLKYVNFTLVLGTLLSASVLYNLEHTTRSQERDIARAKARMFDNAEAIKLLKAEWSSLTRPERIQALAVQHLGMVQLTPDKVVALEEVSGRLDEQSKLAAPAGKGGIDDLLQKMQ
jgi:cell division protein FtsL